MSAGGLVSPYRRSGDAFAIGNDKYAGSRGPSRLVRLDLIRGWPARSGAARGSDPPALDRLLGQRGARSRGASRSVASRGTDLLRHLRARGGSRRARRARAGGTARDDPVHHPGNQRRPAAAAARVYRPATRDRALMGEYATGRAWTVAIVAVTLMIAAATIVLGIVLLCSFDTEDVEEPVGQARSVGSVRVSDADAIGLSS